MMELTIDDLRHMGFEVKVQHYRYTNHSIQAGDEAHKDFTRMLPIQYWEHDFMYEYAREKSKRDSIFTTDGICPRGGATRVELCDGEETYTAWSRCSVKDNFNRKIALRIAVGRAVKSMRQLGIEI